MQQRIVWLAIAEGRGHLARACLARDLLGPRGIDVQIVTTSRAGVAYARSLGAAAVLLPRSYALYYDHDQNLRRARTGWALLRYLTSPRRFGGDGSALAMACRGARILVNDSLHPAALRVSTWMPTVHVYGETTLESLVAGLPSRVSGRLVRMLERSHGRIAYGVGVQPQRSGPRSWCLPPLVRPSLRSRAEVRAELGVAQGRLAVVYLNPYFRDPALAHILEQSLETAGYAWLGVGEGYAERPGWRALEPRLADLIAAADLVCSAPGVGVATQVAATATPWVALATDQPEQVRNLHRLAREGGPHVVSVGPHLRQQLYDALQRLPEARAPSCTRPPLQDIASAWVRVLEDRVATARQARPPVALRRSA